MLVFVEDSAQALTSSHVQASDSARISDRRRQRMERVCVRDTLMRPVLVEEGFELAQRIEQVALVPDQCPVEQFAAAGLHPPFRDRIHSRHPDSGQHGLDARIGQDSVEEHGELAVSVTMFARMSRHGPVADGIMRHRLSRFAVQPGTS